jgi:hypothetical protein
MNFKEYKDKILNESAYKDYLKNQEKEFKKISTRDLKKISNIIKNKGPIKATIEFKKLLPTYSLKEISTLIKEKFKKELTFFNKKQKEYEKDFDKQLEEK